MLIAHVEQRGVWCVEGGMQRLAEALRTLAEDLGVRFRLGEGVSKVIVANGRATGVVTSHDVSVSADAIVCNADPAALAAGALGEDAIAAAPAPEPRQRSLSALTWSLQATARGFPLSRHTIFFSGDYAREFVQLRTGLPEDPTIYVCAQDRNEQHTPTAPERLFILTNAPPLGDSNSITQKEIDACEARMLANLQRHDLQLEITSVRRTSPRDFNALFPATGGALYGRATQGWAASFLRSGARTRIPGFYLAGGDVHPGAGVPMAALSGRLAARQILEDRISTPPSRRAVTPGGTSTPSAKIAAKR
jgi:1-hydroxycarotenoid 3,4-desaturase